MVVNVCLQHTDLTIFSFFLWFLVIAIWCPGGKFENCWLTHEVHSWILSQMHMYNYSVYQRLYTSVLLAPPIEIRLCSLYVCSVTTRSVILALSLQLWQHRCLTGGFTHNVLMWFNTYSTSRLLNSDSTAVSLAGVYIVLWCDLTHTALSFCP